MRGCDLVVTSLSKKAHHIHISLFQNIVRKQLYIIQAICCKDCNKDNANGFPEFIFEHSHLKLINVDTCKNKPKGKKCRFNLPQTIVLFLPLKESRSTGRFCFILQKNLDRKPYNLKSNGIETDIVTFSISEAVLILIKSSILKKESITNYTC